MVPSAWAQVIVDPWLEALRERDLGQIETLLASEQVNPNRTASDGRSALMLAAREADADLVVALLGSGAEVNAKTTNGDG